MTRKAIRFYFLFLNEGENPASGYKDLGEALGITKPTDKGDVVLETVRKWLETNSNWVLVFDNVENGETIAPFLPTKGQWGHILTTSRNPHTKNSLLVNLFSPEESMTSTKPSRSIKKSTGRSILILPSAFGG